MYIVLFAVIVETNASLSSKLSCTYHLSKKCMWTILWITCFSLKYFHNSKYNIKTY